MIPLMKCYIITYIHLSAGSRVPRTVEHGASSLVRGRWSTARVQTSRCVVRGQLPCALQGSRGESRLFLDQPTTEADQDRSACHPLRLRNKIPAGLARQNQTMVSVNSRVACSAGVQVSLHLPECICPRQKCASAVLATVSLSHDKD